MADAHGAGHGGAHKKKPAGGGGHGAGGHGSSEGPSGWVLVVGAIIAVVMMYLFYSGSIGPTEINY